VELTPEAADTRALISLTLFLVLWLSFCGCRR
jgi:hypothetical protein